MENLEQINFLMKHLRYTQALCEITLEKLAEVYAESKGTSAEKMKDEFIKLVHNRVSEIEMPQYH